MASNPSYEQVTADIHAQVVKDGLPPLIHREFVQVDGAAGEEESIVRLMQWNLLAQGLCADEFVVCAPEAFEPDRRRLLIIEELLRYHPTIICLEEVDQFVYIRDTLAPAGYTGIFFPKPDSPCLYRENNYGPDGCAIFYDVKKVRLLSSKNIVIRNGNFDTNQVSIIAKFQTKSSNQKQFYVSVTHLKARKGYGNLRKNQCLNLTRYLWKHCKDVPLLVCGDFNAPPTEKAYEVMSTCDLDLESAYTSLSDDGTEPKYTTWKIQAGGEVCEVLDYIWYSKNKVKMRALLDVASKEEIGATRLPSISYPSDHISLVCDFTVQ